MTDSIFEGFDAGPVFNPDQPSGTVGVLTDDVPGDPPATWTEARTRQWLKDGSAAAHTVLGGESGPIHADMRFTSDELDGLVPPITRWLNRQDAWRRIADRSDGFQIIMTVFGYGTRLYGEDHAWRILHSLPEPQGQLDTSGSVG